MMQHFAKDILRMVGLAACMELGSLAANAQPAPKAPANLCIAGAVCVAAAATPGTPSSATPLPSGPASKGAKKWHPGYYLSTDRNNGALQNQSVRFQQYDGSDVANNAQLVGMFNIFRWDQLEGAHGDYSNGIALIRAEIAHLKALPQPKRLIAMIMEEPNDSICHGFSCQTAFFPAYLNNAGCVDYEGDAFANGSNLGLTRFKIWVPTCRQYFIDLLNGPGAALDSEPYLEALGLNYETAHTAAFVKNGANDSTLTAAFSAVSTAAAAAFPHTNLFWSPNYSISNNFDVLAGWMADWKSKGIGWGNGDSCPRGDWGPSPFFNNGEMPVAIWADNVTAGYGDKNNTRSWHAGQYPDHRGSAFLIWKVETSELGFNSVCGGPGVTGMPLSPSSNSYGSLYPFWNTMQASHGIVEHNTFVGINEQRWSVGTPNSLWDLVQNHPLKHTACPTSYDTLFGNGSAGSGCNTH